MTSRFKKRFRKTLIWLSFPVILLGLISFSVTQPLLGSRSPYPSVKSNPIRLRGHVTALASTREPRSASHPVGLEEAANYIQHTVEELGVSVTEQRFKARGEQSFRNLLWSLGPKDGPRVVVGAHYDVCGNQPGADDNASGIAGLIELTQLLQENPTALPYRLDFVAYTLEEPPYFRSEFMGSAVHARSLKEANADVKAMICLEMIGYFDPNKGSQRYPVGAMKLAYPSRGDFIAVIGKLGEGKLARRVKRHIRNGSDIPVRSINAPAVVPGIDFSDHLNYWTEGYPAVMITNTAFYRNANYHEITDTPETLDYNRMAEVVKGVYWALVSFDQ